MGKWNLAVNLKGVTPLDPTSMGLPTGIYKVQVVDSDQKPSSDPTKPPNIVVEVMVMEGEQKGRTVLIWVGTDTSKSGVRKSWRALLESAGAPAAALENENLTVSAETIQGRTALLYVQAKPEGAGKDEFDQRNFVTEAMAAKIRQSLATVSAPAGNAAPPTTPQPGAAVAPPAAGGALRF